MLNNFHRLMVAGQLNRYMPTTTVALGLGSVGLRWLMVS